MALIPWNDTLAVNIGEIDNQHQCLVELVNQLHDSMKSGKGNSLIGPILSDLLSYTRFHFETEEKYMKQYAYPEYLRHKMEHDELTRKAKALNDSYTAGKLTITIEVMDFLKTWIKNHILKSDKKYAPFLCQKGLS